MAESVTVTRLAHKGDGVVPTEAGDVYVPFVLPGEVVQLGDTGTPPAIVSASPDRVEPPCAHFTVCGGCALQHMATPAYLAWKREQVVAAFAQRGIEAVVRPVVAIPPSTRRRITFAAVNASGGAVLGFQKRASHTIVPIAACPVAVPAIADRLDLLRRIAAAALPAGKSGRITVVAADNGLDVAVDAGREPGRKQREALATFAADPAVARLAVEGEVIAQARRPEMAIGAGAMLYPVPGGFLQASAAAEAAIAAEVSAAVGDRAPVADLFAGLGTLTLRLARKAAVTAVDSDAPLLDALAEAARKAAGLRPITIQRRDLFGNPLSPPELARFGAVVFDPPRAGAAAQAEALAQSRVPVVAAVSCNPATLARDARMLIDGGYRLEAVIPIDQFLWSAHVEAVAVFCR